MRFYLGHLLPGGFWGGIGVGSYRGRQRRQRYVAPRQRKKVTQTVVVTRQPHQTTVTRYEGSPAHPGLTLLLILVLLGFIIRYWWLILLILILAGVAIQVFHYQHIKGTTENDDDDLERQAADQ